MKKAAYIMVVMMVLAAVMPWVQALAQEERPLLTYVQDLHMAESILRPQAQLLTVTRDPFKPIITPAPKPSLTALGEKVVEEPSDKLDDVQIIGIVRLDTEFRAYIKVGDKGRVVSLQDKVRGFQIIHMDMDQIVFKSGNKEVTKKEENYEKISLYFNNDGHAYALERASPNAQL